jgi:hypothetical protein
MQPADELDKGIAGILSGYPAQTNYLYFKECFQGQTLQC